MTDTNHEGLIVGMHDRGILKFGDFPWVLKSGRESPLYFNMRAITSVDRSLEMSQVKQRGLLRDTIDAFAERIDLSADHVYGIPQGMTHFAGMVAMKLDRSSLWGRIGTNSYGEHKPIEGAFDDGDMVVQLDDVVTDAGSKLDSARMFENYGLNTSEFIIGLDRQEGGAQAVNEGGYSIQSIFDASTAVEVLRMNNRIGLREINWMKQYHEGLRNDGIHSTFTTEV